MNHRTLLRRLLLVSIFAAGVVATPARAAPPGPEALLFAPVLEGELNINTATADQWALLPGIGPATAAKILEYRDRRPFRAVAQLMRIKGIGKKTYARIRIFLTLEGETTLQVAAPVAPADP